MISARKLKGSVTPAIVVLALVSTMMGGFSAGVLVEQASSIFGSATKAQNSEWFSENVIDPAHDMCNEGGVQKPYPRNSNVSKTFDGLKEIQFKQEVNTYSAGRGSTTVYSRYLVFKYENGERTERWSYSTTGYEPCSADRPQLNTSTDAPDNTVTLNPDRTVKFRVIETADKDIVIQVRQD